MNKAESYASVARRMRANGMSFLNIAKALGISPDTAKRAVDPEYGERRRVANSEARRKWRARKSQGNDAPRSGLSIAMDAERLMREIPRDTRTITGRVFGDPLPGRSALDRLTISAS